MGPQILWEGLEVLGPEDDVEEKERRRERKIKFSSFLFCFSTFYAESSIPSVTVPASCALTESRNYSLIGIIL